MASPADDNTLQQVSGSRVITGLACAGPSVLEIALDELKKAGSHADDKAERAAASAVSRSKATVDALERERIKLQIKGDKATRKSKFVYS